MTTSYPSKLPDADAAHRLYVVEKKSLREIAEIYDCTKASVSKWLKKNGVQTRSISEATVLSGKYGVHSESHRETLRRNIAVARTKITGESREKHRQKMLGRVAPNKGVPWSDEVRATQMAVRATDEYKENLAASKRGEKNYNWKGGPSDDSSLLGWQWRKRRKEVYARDSWICQDCGCKCLNTKDSKLHPKRKIQAHHIVARRDGGSDDLGNLVTLCMSCHHKRERCVP